MSKNNNVNPNFYKTGGREHTDGSDKGDTKIEQKQKVVKNKDSKKDEKK